MRGTKRLRMWVRALIAKRTVERELDEEMRFHIDMETAKHAHSGLSADEARRRAAIAFGGLEDHKEAMREGRSSPPRFLRYLLFKFESSVSHFSTS